MKRFRIKNEQLKETLGFTLIELMVAIAIVAVLATIGIVAFGATQKSARDAKRKGDLEDIKKALYLYRTAKGTFCLKGKGSCLSSDETYRLSGGTYSALLDTELGPYLKGNKFPVEPGGSNSNYQIYIPDDDNFVVYAILENPPSSSTLIGCTLPTGSTLNYCIAE